MGLWDFLTFNTHPKRPEPATMTRASIQPLELREANAALHVSHTVGRPQWPRMTPENFNQQAYQKLTLIFRCVNLLASAVGEAPVRVYRDRDGQQETLPDHPLRQLLTRPNPLMGESKLMYNLMVRMCIYGFGAMEIERTSAGRPMQLWPLRSEWLKPIPRNNDAHDWEYRIPGNDPVLIEADDIIVVSFAELGDGDPRGIGPLEVAMREWSLLNTMQDYLKAFFDHGALPVYGLLLNPEADVNQDDADVLKQRWNEAINSTDPLILDSITGIQRLSFDYNELAYIDLRDVSEIAILQAFGIPGSLVGQRFAQERNTFSNYGEARTSFYQDTVQKLWARIDDVLTRSLLPELDSRGDTNLEFDISGIDALQEDQQTKRTHDLEALKAGAISRADYRRSVGLPVDPSDDVYLMPFSVIEVPVGQSVPPRAIPAATERALTAGTEHRGRLPIERRDALQRRSLHVYERGERRWAPEIDRYFQRQKVRVLDALTSQRAHGPLLLTREALKVDDIDWDFELDDLDRLIGELWGQVGEQAMGDVVTLLPMDDGMTTVDPFDLANQWVDTVRDEIGSRVVGITETTKADIQRVVNEALAEGTSIDDLSARLEGLYEESYRNRSRAIARTESQVAYNTASVEGYQQRGVTQVELADNPNHTTDPGSDGLTCAQRHGLVVPIQQVSRHIQAEHPNGSLSILPVLSNWD
jgi:HK97 family phage portal protein